MRLWPTSLLFGVLAISAAGSGCGASDAPVTADAGIDLEDIDLAVYPVRQYTGFDGAHEFQIPFGVFRAKEDLVVTASDPDAVTIVPATYDEAKTDGQYFLVTAQRAGVVTLTATSRGKTVSATLGIESYAAASYAAGQTRYENAGENGQPSCASCHQKEGGADHSPAAISSASDDAVKAVIKNGIDLSNSPITTVDHRWAVEGATLDGLVTYLRALPCRGYEPATTASRSQHASTGTSLASRDHVDALGMRHLREGQLERGVPVLGAERIRHFGRNGALRSMQSTWVPDVTGLAALDVVPTVSAPEAERVVLATFAARGGDPARARLGFAAWNEPDTTPRLGVHVRRGARRLVWQVGLASDVGGRPVRLLARVDAHDGSLVEIYDDAKTVRATSKGVFGQSREFEVNPNGASYQLHDTTRGGGILTYTAGEDQDLPGAIVASTELNDDWDQDAANGKGAAVDAHFFAGEVFDFYQTSFGRLGLDGKSGSITTSVHYGLKYDNAFWEGRQIVLGDGDRFKPFAGALDVVAHELTHAMTQSESALEYAFQSGAMNEAISDIFGAIVEHHLLPDPVANWTIGETLELDGTLPLRNLKSPGDAEVPQPDHMDEYLDLTLDQDNGGVHLNSGIVNNAAYLMTMGGTHRLSKLTVERGIGWDKLEQLFYRVDTEYLVRQSEFTDLAEATIAAATDLDFTDADKSAVDCAWKAVGVLEGECGGATAIPDADAGSASATSSSGDIARGNDENADFSKQASACDAGFTSGSRPGTMPFLLLLLVPLLTRRRFSNPALSTRSS